MQRTFRVGGLTVLAVLAAAGTVQASAWPRGPVAEAEETRLMIKDEVVNMFPHGEGSMMKDITMVCSTDEVKRGSLCCAGEGTEIAPNFEKDGNILSTVVFILGLLAAVWTAFTGCIWEMRRREKAKDCHCRGDFDERMMNPSAYVMKIGSNDAQDQWAALECLVMRNLALMTTLSLMVRGPCRGPRFRGKSIEQQYVSAASDVNMPYTQLKLVNADHARTYHFQSELGFMSVKTVPMDEYKANQDRLSLPRSLRVSPQLWPNFDGEFSVLENDGQGDCAWKALEPLLAISWHLVTRIAATSKSQIASDCNRNSKKTLRLRKHPLKPTRWTREPPVLCGLCSVSEAPRGSGNPPEYVATTRV